MGNYFFDNIYHLRKLSISMSLINGFKDFFLNLSGDLNENSSKLICHNYLSIFVDSYSFWQSGIGQGSCDHDIPAEHGIPLFRAYAEAVGSRSKKDWGD